MDAGIRAEWPAIELAWRQNIAAFWSISWPAGSAAILVFSLALGYAPNDQMERAALIAYPLSMAVFRGAGLLDSTPGAKRVPHISCGNRAR